MRISGRVAVAGEMFGRGDHARVLRAFDKRRDKPRYIRRIFAVRTDVDDRVGRVVIHVRHRRVNLLDAERPRLARSQIAGAPRQVGIARGRNRHVPGKVHRVIETHSRSGFQVGRDQQRILCQRLHPVNDHDRFVNGAAEENDPADVIVYDLMTQGLERFAVLIQKSRVDSH